MRLLIITQKIDRDDPILGFFHRWVEEFAKHCEQVTVICLEEGKHNFYSAKNAVPRSENSEEFSGTGVRVFSLGKEEVKCQMHAPLETARARSANPSLMGSNVKCLKKSKYIFNFFKIIWRERKNYDAVFVHMNQEYVLLGAPLWKLLRKKVTMWRNHHFGNIFTRIAVVLCDTVFCTSKYSFTAQFKKTVLMPVGIDTNLFKRDESIRHIPRSILFLGRISPVKQPDMLIDAVALLKKENILVEAHLYGDPAPQDKEYFESLKKKTDTLGITKQIHFHLGIPNEKTPAIYNQYEVFVNASPSGMYDKTIFEAMACESLILTSNLNLKGQIDDMFLFKEDDVNDLTQKLKAILNLDTEAQKKYGKILRNYVVEKQSLALLGIALKGNL